MYTWGYIKNVALAKLDIASTVDEDTEIQELITRFPYYANEAMTQICSAVKPKRTFAEFEITADDIGIAKSMPSDFISFGDDVNHRTYQEYNAIFYEEAHDDDFAYLGYNTLLFKKEGKYQISYNARWIDFNDVPRTDADGYPVSGPIDEDVVLDIPYDILDCIPSYIASQCYKIDDEYKSAVYRNEFEMALARIDDTDFKNTKTFKIGGDW